MEPKEKVLMLLEHDMDDAEKDYKRWSHSYQRYAADLLFNEENNLPLNLRSVASRNLAKDEMARARETKRLYGIAIDAVRRA